MFTFVVSRSGKNFDTLLSGQSSKQVKSYPPCCFYVQHKQRIFHEIPTKGGSVDLTYTVNDVVG